jgi:hypothetical protein
MTANIKAYYNLHKQCFSIIDKAQRRVVEHTDDIMIKGASFIVQPAGRNKAVRTGQKNVHAFVDGERVDVIPYPHEEGMGVLYNPFVYKGFIIKGGDEETLIHSASYVHLTTKLGFSLMYVYGTINT